MKSAKVPHPSLQPTLLIAATNLQQKHHGGISSVRPLLLGRPRGVLCWSSCPGSHPWLHSMAAQLAIRQQQAPPTAGRQLRIRRCPGLCAAQVRHSTSLPGWHDGQLDCGAVTVCVGQMLTIRYASSHSSAWLVMRCGWARWRLQTCLCPSPLACECAPPLLSQQRHTVGPVHPFKAVSAWPCPACPHCAQEWDLHPPTAEQGGGWRASLPAGG